MESKTLVVKAVVVAGGLLLLVGAVMPWLTLTHDNPWPGSPFPAVYTGLQGNESYNGNTFLGGLILVLLGIFKKVQPGRRFSMFGVIVSILCGLVLLERNLIYAFYLFAIAEDGGHAVFGVGLTRLSPLGAFLGLIGSLLKISGEPASAAVTPPEPSVGPGVLQRQDTAMKPRRFLVTGGTLLIVSIVTSWITVTNNDPFFSRSSGTTSHSLGLSWGTGISVLLGSLILILLGIFKKGKPGEAFSGFGVLVSSLSGLHFFRLVWYYSYFVAPFSGLVTREGDHMLLLILIAFDILLGLIGALLGMIGSAMKMPAESVPWSAST